MTSFVSFLELDRRVRGFRSFHALSDLTCRHPFFSESQTDIPLRGVLAWLPSHASVLTRNGKLHQAASEVRVEASRIHGGRSALGRREVHRQGHAEPLEKPRRVVSARGKDAGSPRRRYWLGASGHAG